jgi:hypothetical protein
MCSFKASLWSSSLAGKYIAQPEHATAKQKNTEAKQPLRTQEFEPAFIMSGLRSKPEPALYENQGNNRALN